MSVLVLVLGSSAGGVGRHVASLARAEAGAGTQVHVVAPAETLRRFELDGPGLRAHPVDIGASLDPVRDLRAARALRALLRELPEPLVHAHGIRAASVAAAAVRPSRRSRVPLVLTLHNAVLGGGPRAALGRAVQRVACRSADVVLGVSADLVAQARAAGAPVAERALVPAPARPPARSAALVRADLGLPADVRVVLTVARAAPQKDLGLLLDALARRVPPPAGPDLLALVAGDGPLLPALRARVDAEHLPVRLLGARDDVGDLLAVADVVVQTSRWEGQPVFVQEALRAGAALVATDAGGTAEVTGDAALLTPVGDAAALAAALQALLDDPDALARARVRSRARADELPGPEEALAQVRRVWGAARARRGRRGPGVG
ncbi:glycosyltransferase family 4 protein [Kineococcus gynurae]|uniref:Glycosyltransferase family 4 protein n=1 Tax=Kineococcus gynurae TaxID=452979 RepID=A0ABV5LXP9_9ACTN